MHTEGELLGCVHVTSWYKISETTLNSKWGYSIEYGGLVFRTVLITKGSARSTNMDFYLTWCTISTRYLTSFAQMKNIYRRSAINFKLMKHY